MLKSIKQVLRGSIPLWGDEVLAALEALRRSGAHTLVDGITTVDHPLFDGVLTWIVTRKGLSLWHRTSLVLEDSPLIAEMLAIKPAPRLAVKGNLRFFPSMVGVEDMAEKAPERISALA